MSILKVLLILCLVVVCVLSASPSLATDPCAGVDKIYVDANVTTGNDGDAWGTAWQYLQDAFTDPDLDAGDCILVAGAPDYGLSYASAVSSETDTFNIPSGVQIYGGFNPAQSSPGPDSPEDRDNCDFGDCNGFISILDGGLISYHVLTAIETDPGTIISGFTIIGGAAVGDGEVDFDRHGGGLLMRGGDLTIEFCHFLDNGAAVAGGGIYVGEGESEGAASLSITKTKFTENVASNGTVTGSGGGMYSRAGTLTMERCWFEENFADINGAGLFNGIETGETNDTVLKNVLFWKNKGGGGVYNAGGSATSVSLTNCTLSRNFTNNTAAGGVASAGSTEVVTITNSILWDNEAGGTAGSTYTEAGQFSGGDTDVAYSNVRHEAGGGGVTPGTGNINLDPVFRCEGPPGRINGDDRYPLLNSPCRNAGVNTPVSWNDDLDDDLRIVESDVDMGINEIQIGACCYDSTCTEGTSDECRRPFVCDVNELHDGTHGYGDCGLDAGGCCYGDANGDGTVTQGDRGFVGANEGQSDPVLLCLYDMDGNGVINPADRGFVSANIYPLCTALPDWQNGSGINAGVCPDPRYDQLVGEFQGGGTDCEEVECGGESMMGGGSQGSSESGDDGPGIDLQSADGGWYSILLDSGDICVDAASVFAVSDHEETVIDDSTGGSLTSLGELTSATVPSTLFGAGYARRDMVLLDSLSSSEEAGGELCQVLPASGVTLRLEVYVWRVNEDDSIDAWSAALSDEQAKSERV